MQRFEGPLLDRKRPGPKPKGNAKTASERHQKRRDKVRTLKAENIAILDFETDRFDNVSQSKIMPFLAVLYSAHWEPVVIWDENFDHLIARLLVSLEALPEPYTIYAHNGGRFDYMFLIHKLRGKVQFKGRAIMSARIGVHEIRDSFHIIPDPLRSYKKDEFDYAKNDRHVRHANKAEIIKYCINECRYLLELVRRFLDDFGMRLTFGQAAMLELQKHYPDIAHLKGGWDQFLRGFFFGGRVECLQGAGDFRGAYKTFDVNSMYSDAMAKQKHPIGAMEDYKFSEVIGPDTCFINLNCTNRGALIMRDPETGETTATVKKGNFLTTIYEYEMALKLERIENVEIVYALDCSRRTDFSKHIDPIYGRRLLTKRVLADLRSSGIGPGDPDFDRVLTDDLFLKFLLNAGYGKFAQNPRDFKEHWLTGPDELPPPEWFKSLEPLPEKERLEFSVPAEECRGYRIWSKPNPGWRFNNVGTAASITGAARAKLLGALHTAIDPIYCDTDAIICRALGADAEISKEKLGAWDLEDEFSRVRITGKKTYGGEYEKPKMGPSGEVRYKIRAKGTSEVTWQNLGDLLELGPNSTNSDIRELGPNSTNSDIREFGGIAKTAKAPTLYRSGVQEYMTRVIRRTAPFRETLTLEFDHHV